MKTEIPSVSRLPGQGDNVCDLGAFGGHYSEWLNAGPLDGCWCSQASESCRMQDTGLVSAYAFDAIPGVEDLP